MPGVWKFGCIVVLSACALGCVEDAGEDKKGGKEDSTGVVAALEGHEDPLGVWFREQSGVDSSGILEADFIRILTEVSEQEGCSPADIRTFVISDSLITGEEAFPRSISTVCVNDPAKQGTVFLSTVAATDEMDVDLRTIEMFSWDASARMYRFYRVDPVEGSDSEVHLEVDPAECRQCHLGSSSMDGTFIPMVPIMNELTRPWPHWNGAPSAESHSFELPEVTQSSPNYQACTESWLGSAQDLEQLIRGAIESKVNASRIRSRRNSPASVTEAMAQLRPLFCDERINYVTEDSGQVRSAVYVDDGIGNMMKKISESRSDLVLSWAWYNDRTVRLGDASDPSQELTMLAVRGHADVDYELRLVSASGGLSPEQVLRIKALDWERPVFSEFRCGLWTSAEERLRLSPPEFDESGRMYTLWPVLFDEIMKIQGPEGLVSLTPPEGAEVIALGLADATRVEELGAALSEGLMGATICEQDGFCGATVSELGDRIHSYIEGIEADASARAGLMVERNARACFARANYPNSPEIQDIEGCE